MAAITLKDFFTKYRSSTELTVPKDNFNDVYLSLSANATYFIENSNSGSIPWRYIYSPLSSGTNHRELFINKLDNLDLVDYGNRLGTYLIFIRSIYGALDLRSPGIVNNLTNRSTSGYITYNNSASKLVKLKIDRLDLINSTNSSSFPSFNHYLGFGCTNKFWYTGTDALTTEDFLAANAVYIRKDNHWVYGPIDEYYSDSYFGFDVAGKNKSFTDYGSESDKVKIIRNNDSTLFTICAPFFSEYKQ